MDEIIKIITDKNFLTAIISTVLFILLGFILRQKNFFKENDRQTLIKLTYKITIPCLAFSAFMTDFDATVFKNNIAVLIIGFVLFTLLFVLSDLVFRFVHKDNFKVISCLVVMGQMTLYSIPVLKIFYPSDNNVLMASNLLTLSYRFFLYFYSWMIVSRSEFNKENLKKSLKDILLNPIVIGMLAGFIVYLSQNFMPKVEVDGIKYSFLRLDMTLPYVYRVISLFATVTSPLAMLLIGATLGNADVKTVFTNKFAYLVSFCRTIICPLVIIGIIYLTNLIGITNFNEVLVLVIVICFAAPVSVTVDIFCMKYDNEELLACNSCFLSVLMTIITIPLLYILVSFLF